MIHVRDAFYVNRWFEDAPVVDEQHIAQYCLPRSLIDAIGPADGDMIVLPQEVALQRKVIVKSQSQKHMATMPCIWMERFGNCPFMCKTGSCPFYHVKKE